MTRKLKKKKYKIIMKKKKEKNTHCTAGLQFNKTGTDQKRKYAVICM